jgi:beta-carotene hydroxylase
VRMGSLVWVFGFGLPAFFAQWSSIFVNYIQHVHCDPWSKYDHARNFVSKAENWLLFNNGYHTAHHASAGTHWSELPEAHAKIAGFIHPDLNQRSLFGFCFRTYVLGAMAARFRTRQIGRAAYDPPGGGRMTLVTGPVAAVGAGVNAPMRVDAEVDAASV